MELVDLARTDREYRSPEAVRYAVGRAVLRPAGRFRAGDGPHAWVDTVVGVVEGILDTETGAARARVFECRPTLL